MKRHSFVLFVLTCLSLATTQARNVDSVEARAVASRFAYLHNIKGTPMLVKTIDNERLQIPAVYVFSMEEAGSQQKQGFVAVSGDNCVCPILAYSQKNPLSVHDGDAYPPALTSWLSMRADEISYGQNNNIPPSEMATKQWAELQATTNTKSSAKDEANILLTTTWDQGWPYNKYCPVIDGNTAPVGCVATALSQILRYWKHPAQGQGSTAYMCGACGERITMDFSETFYDFDSMPDQLFFYSPSSMVEPTATLCYHAGVSVWMQYSSGSSGVGMSNVGTYCRRALVNNFKYDTTVHYLYRGSFSDDEWVDTIRKEIQAGRPVLYCGYDNTSSGVDAGHAFVLDGYDESDGFFHINWGWGSGGDGWFDLYNNQLNVYGYRFTTMHVAIIGIQPAPEPEPESIVQPLAIQNAAFTIYPNPAASIIHISRPIENHVAEVCIRSVAGQIVYRQPCNGDIAIDVSSYPSGIYFCTIDGHTAKFAVVK